MTAETRISDLDLAALLCSRVCHDVISPVGAIANGLELFDDPEMDQETKETALDMIRSSAKTASAKLKFCRIAFGAAGSAGAFIDMGEAGETAKGFVGEEKVKLDWQAPRENRPKQEVKLLLNMLLLGLAGIPRGGTVTVSAEGGDLSVRAQGERAKVPEALAEVIDGKADLASLDARLVQPYYTRLLALSAGRSLVMILDGDDVLVAAKAA
ncbi:MAG: histidine phosphotransferase [Rhizobiales bacterium]|nr:histidine phosphotransferase [Hyphomicrobiales bacterium]